MGKVTEARRAAHASLVSCLENNKYLNIEITHALERSTLTGADRALYTALVCGVTERLITLDYIIARLARREISEIDVPTLCALRIGLLQLAYMDRIPPHAAVSESVETAPEKSRGFVNAVLRAYLRAPVSLPDRSAGELEYLSVNYSMPRELCALFLRDCGERTEDIFAAFYERRDTALHLNTLNPDAWTAAEKLGARRSRMCEGVVLLQSFDSVVAGLAEGLWFVQDEASALCASVLGAMPGEVVADVCAAPGGKSLSAALSMENKGKLYSFDLHANKLSLIRKGAARLGIDIIECESRDARKPREELVGRCDRVLCDAPCSGLGVIGKKPDIRYKPADRISALPRVQSEVLRGAAGYVREGGTLVYSTCTLNRDENEGVVKAFLAENGDFCLSPFAVQGKSCDGMLTLYPDTDKTDGFFICRMERKK